MAGTTGWALLPLASLAYLVGLAIAAVGSLLAAAGVAAYLLRNSPRTFLTFRKLRPQPEEEPDRDEE